MKTIFHFILLHKKGFIISFILSSVFGILMIGIPGAAIMEINERFVLPYFLNQPYNAFRLPADAAWPTAILLSMLIPWTTYAFIGVFKKWKRHLNFKISFILSVILMIVSLSFLYLELYPPT